MDVYGLSFGPSTADCSSVLVCARLFSFGIMKVPQFQDGPSSAEVASVTSMRRKIKKTHMHLIILYIVHMHRDRNSNAVM